MLLICNIISPKIGDEMGNSDSNYSYVCWENKFVFVKNADFLQKIGEHRRNKDRDIEP
jgi:hypothetical protein